MKDVPKMPLAPRTADFFEERRARADVDAALPIMRRKQGEAAREGDEA